MELSSEVIDDDEEEGDAAYIDILIECPFCGGFVPDDYECLKCGAEIFEEEEAAFKYVCSECRKEVDERDEECPHCGVQLE